MKYAFSNGIFPIYKLFFSDNHTSLGDMIDIIIKKEPCINKIYAMKKHDPISPLKVILEHTQMAKANHVTHK